MKKILVISILFIVILTTTVLAELDCPFGQEDCEYPGDCGRYIDSNDDAICDYSQENIQEQIPQKITRQLEPAKQNSGRNYYFLPILIITIILYALTSILVRIKKIREVIHKRIWNMVLLISFLVTGILGILLVIRLQYGFDLSLGINELFWHVEAGIIMTIISVFHIIWHTPY